MSMLFRVLGVGALIAGGVTIMLVALAFAVLIGPFVFWLAWNVLEFGPAIGLAELGFWPIVLATLFLIAGWLGKVAITAVVFLVDPNWLEGAAEVSWPEPTLRNFTAIALLAILVTRPHARAHETGRRADRPT